MIFRLSLPRIGLILCGLAAAGPAFAASPADKPYTVANYPVDAAAKDAVTAKSKAIEDGQQAALHSLFKRLVPVTAYNRMDRLKVVKAAEYLDGFAVRSEQNSQTEYIASLDFSFQPDAVRELLRREGVPFVEEQAQRTVLVPAIRESKEGAAASVRPAGGTWARVWRDLDLDNTLTPLKVEALKPDLPAGTSSALADGDGAALGVLAGAHKSQELIVAIADVDQAAGRLTVTVAGQDAVGPINWRRGYKIADGDADYALELAAVVTLGVIEGRWKSAKTSPSASGAYSLGAGGGGDIRIDVEFASAEEWNDIRGRLLNTDGIDDLRIGTVTSSTAEISVRYAGGPGALANELVTQGLSLRSTYGGWLLKSGY